MYTIVLFACDVDSGEALSLSRESDTADKAKVVKLMMKEAGLTDKDNLDTILVMKNGKRSPEVVKHWSARNGDF